MSRGLGAVQRAVLTTVESNPAGLAVDDLVHEIYGGLPTAAQREAVRRAIRTLARSSLVELAHRWETRPRKSLKRYVDIAPCLDGFCPLCAERRRRVRISDWHRRVMTTNSEHDPDWLDDLKLAEASSFVHETTSDDRVVTEKPDTIDLCRRRLQIVMPVSR